MKDERKTKAALLAELKGLRAKLGERAAASAEPASSAARSYEMLSPDIATVGEHGVLVTGPEGRLLSARPAAATILRRPDGTVLYTLHSDVADGEGAHALRTTARPGGAGETPPASVEHSAAPPRRETSSPPLPADTRRDRLVVMGQLTGGVAHELRNSLGAISNASYFLDMALEKPDPGVKESLGILRKQVANAERIITSLLDFARSRPPEFEPTDLNEVAREAVVRLKPSRSVKLTTDLAALPEVAADAGQLGQVLDNLLHNALQAMPDGGQLTVTTAHDTNEVVLAVNDTGVGISPDDREHLFEPLFTTRSRGIGLGLVITRMLVEGHGGTIDVTSTEGEGSTFTVRLPTKEPD